MDEILHSSICIGDIPYHSQICKDSEETTYMEHIRRINAGLCGYLDANRSRCRVFGGGCLKVSAWIASPLAGGEELGVGELLSPSSLAVVLVADGLLGPPITASLSLLFQFCCNGPLHLYSAFSSLGMDPKNTNL